MNLAKEIAALKTPLALQLGSVVFTPVHVEAIGDRLVWADGDQPHVMPAGLQAKAMPGGGVMWQDKGGAIVAFIVAAADHEDLDNASAVEKWTESRELVKTMLPQWRETWKAQLPEATVPRPAPEDPEAAVV